MRKPATLIAALIFDLVALAHLIRVITGVPITIGEWEMPIWVSIVGIIAAGALAVLLYLEWRRKD